MLLGSLGGHAGGVSVGCVRSVVRQQVRLAGTFAGS